MTKPVVIILAAVFVIGASQFVSRPLSAPDPTPTVTQAATVSPPESEVRTISASIERPVRQEERTDASPASRPESSRLLGRWERHVNGEPISWLNQSIELKADGTYEYVWRDREDTLQRSYGTYRVSADERSISFENDPSSKTALALDTAEIVEGSMIRFTPFHAFCNRSHPHGEGLEQPQYKPPVVTDLPAAERRLISELRHASYQEPAGGFVVDLGENDSLLVTINELASKARPIEARVADYLKSHGIVDIAARRENGRLVYFYESPD